MGIQRPRNTAYCIAVTMFASACTGAGDATPALEVTRTDTAGIEIVLNHADAASVPVFATLDSVPSLSIGALDGRPEEPFGNVIGVLPLGDGGVAVLDGQAAVVRVFDSSGAYQMTLGARGEGPGEFQGPIELGLLPGDTIAVYDSRAMRITRFGPDGALGRMTTLENPGAHVTPGAFLGDGRFVGQTRWRSSTGPASLPGPEPTFMRDTVMLTLFTTDGAIHDTVDVVPGRETITSIRQSGQAISV